MQVARERTQFDQPDTVGTPATPSCCCCCCCAATTLTTVGLATVTAHEEAKRAGRSSRLATLLAFLALPAGWLVVALSVRRLDAASLLLGLLTMLAVLTLAFSLSNPESTTLPFVRSVKYSLLMAVAFALELIVTLFLLFGFLEALLGPLGRAAFALYGILVILCTVFVVQRHHNGYENRPALASVPPKPLIPPPDSPPPVSSAPPAPPEADTNDQPPAWPPRSDFPSTPTGGGSLPPSSPDQPPVDFRPPPNWPPRSDYRPNDTDQPPEDG